MSGALRAAALSALLAAGAAGAAGSGTIERLDPRFDALVPAGATLEKLVDGFAWLEGPVWEPVAGALLFSDVGRNTVFRWREAEGARAFLEASGYSGAAPFLGREPGANGLALDAAGRLLLCQHGDRRLVRLEPDGRRTVLVERFEGRRLNSPNDVTVSRSGDLLFTDPPFGLPKAFEDPGKELGFSGVYRLSREGELRLLVDELRAPNGIALSPTETTLYLSNSDAERPLWMAYPLLADGSVGPGRVFFDADEWARRWPGLPDGMETDPAGNLFAAGPGGVYVFAPDGTLLGRLVTGVATSNVAFGPDGSLYLTAGSAVHRLRRVPPRTAGASNAANPLGGR